MVWPMIAAAAIPVVAGVAGVEQTHEERRKAREAQQKAADELLGIKIPGLSQDFGEVPVYERPGDVRFEGYQSQGQLTPEELQAISQGPSAMEGVYVDPRLKEAQLQALMRLQRIGSEGGMTLEDKARLAEMQGNISAEERGNREAILQNMRARGISGSGLELAAQLSNQQASANRASQQGLDIEAMAQKRALEALMAGGSMAGQQAQQEFGQKADIAAAQDAIARFNAMNSQNVMGSNVAARNAAQAGNLQAAQTLSNANIDMQNRATMQNLANQQYRNQLAGQGAADRMARTQAINQVAQQGFGNQLQKAGAATGAYEGIANQQLQAANQKMGMAAGIGQGASQGVSAAAQYEAAKNKNQQQQ